MARIVRKRTNATDKHAVARSHYKIELKPLEPDDLFYPEYNILSKTIDAANSFDELYRTARAEAKGGPSTHAQQDLYRAVLVFTCAGLDVFVKQLVKNKLPTIIKNDASASEKFKDFVKRTIKRDENILPAVLTSDAPKAFLIEEYVEDLTSGSLQSVDELVKISEAAGLLTKAIFTESNKTVLKKAFDARNEIIHEMDINPNPPTGNKGYRTRRQRRYPEMENHTKNILAFANNFLENFRSKFWAR